ncbi:unnamed protein product [Lathyrus oleraceus]
MVESIKFVYIVIIFISLFVFSINIRTNLICKVIQDCPMDLCGPGMMMKCKHERCACLTVWKPLNFVK